MLRLSILFLGASCARASSQCDCALTLSGHEPNPAVSASADEDEAFPLVYEEETLPPIALVNSSVAVPPKAAIDAVAAQNSDWSKTIIQVLQASGDMIKKLGSGQLPSEGDLLKAVGATVVAAAGIVNPLLGALAGFVFSFFQGLFGSKANPYRALYDKIIHQVKNMIHESEIRSKLRSVSDTIQGYIGLSSYLHRTGQQANANYFYTQRPTVFDSQCLVGDWSATSCKQWEQHGAVVYGVLFASLHLHTLNEIAASHHGNQQVVNHFLVEIADRGDEYVPILRHSLKTWHDHRLTQQHLNYVNEDTGGGHGNCWQNHQGWCRARSVDNYGAAIAGCPVCQTCIVDRHSGAQMTKSIKWHNAWTKCHQNHRATLQTTMNQVSTSIDAIANLVAVAKRVRLPAPAPLPAFTDRLNIGESLTVGNMLVSTHGGWNKLVMQSDGNVVIYSDSYDGVSNAESKGMWAQRAGAGARCNFQTDGNLVLRDGNGVKWASGTAGKGGTYLVMQSDGNLVLLTARGKAVWSSNTRNYDSHQVASDLNATLV